MSHQVAGNVNMDRSSGDYTATGGGSDHTSELILAKLDRINDELEHIKEEMGKVREESRTVSNTVKISQDNTITIFEEIKEKINKNNALCQKIRKENTALKNENKILKGKVNQLQQSIKYNAIKIVNIPLLQNENIGLIVETICAAIEFKIKKDFIDHCYRLRIRNTDRIPPIVLKFVKESDKKEFMRLIKLKELHTEQTLNIKPNKKIFVSEFMSPEYAKLYKEARELKIKNNIKFVWFRNNNLMVRKSENSPAIIINTSEDLRSLLGDVSQEAEVTDIEDLDTDQSERSDVSTKIAKKRKIRTKSAVDRLFRRPTTSDRPGEEHPTREGTSKNQ
ncbi:uncharacterized protein [Rhodnius prolixus]|uniref:uncharacterized protein n=1 Tax=Rhodnius prolixus TaxID=13249 RepID=UPI003D18CB4C